MSEVGTTGRELVVADGQNEILKPIKMGKYVHLDADSGKPLGIDGAEEVILFCPSDDISHSDMVAKYLSKVSGRTVTADEAAKNITVLDGGLYRGMPNETNKFLLFGTTMGMRGKSREGKDLGDMSRVEDNYPGYKDKAEADTSSVLKKNYPDKTFLPEAKAA